MNFSIRRYCARFYNDDSPALANNWDVRAEGAVNVGKEGLGRGRVLSPSPVTRHPAPSAERTFFWRNSKQDASLKGPWKYLNDGEREYLFNLSIDQREQANFRDQNPELFNQLRAEFKTWEATVLPRPPAPG